MVGVYQTIVQSCIHIGQIDKALEYVERSRSKRLVDLMASNDLYGDLDLSQDVREFLRQYESLQQQIDKLRSNNESNSDRGLLNTSNRTRAALKLELTAIIHLEAQKQEVWQQIRQDDITLHTCDGQGVDTLQNRLNEEWTIADLKDNSQWRDRLNSTLAQLAQRLQIDKLIEEHLDGIEELIIIPHHLLHQIPFAAIPVGNDSLCDRFSFSVFDLTPTQSF